MCSMLCPPPDAAHAQPLCDQPSCEAFQEQQYTHFNHVALGHRVDMSSRLPSYFGQTKSTITLLTRLRRRPWSPPILTSGRGVGFVRQLDRSLRLRFLAGIPLQVVVYSAGLSWCLCPAVLQDRVCSYIARRFHSTCAAVLTHSQVVDEG